MPYLLRLNVLCARISSKCVGVRKKEARDTREEDTPRKTKSERARAPKREREHERSRLIRS